ncbi:MAG TPA: DUF4136 domain-containing protein [Xanthobacteraceae bacterium]|nr:DUF4136 domain-containing protein [Xanthobacteraceae bacterium]
MSARLNSGLVAVLAAAGLWLAGCATMTVHSYADRRADFGRYRTYQWGPADTWSTGDPRLDNNRFFDERVRAQVEKQLARRGFEKTASERPDLLVHYHANVAQDIDVRKLDNGATYCVDHDCRPYIYDKGTLFVDLVDPGSDTLIWRGWAEGSVDGVIDDQAWMDTRIDEAVARILGRLPQHLPGS